MKTLWTPRARSVPDEAGYHLLPPSLGFKTGEHSPPPQDTVEVVRSKGDWKKKGGEESVGQDLYRRKGMEKIRRTVKREDRRRGHKGLRICTPIEAKVVERRRDGSRDPQGDEEAQRFDCPEEKVDRCQDHSNSAKDHPDLVGNLPLPEVEHRPDGQHHDQKDWTVLQVCCTRARSSDSSGIPRRPTTLPNKMMHPAAVLHNHSR